MITILLVLLLIAVICMALRDGKAFFGDYLKVSVLVITVFLALVTWAPLVRLR